jgi:4'-phosphopantetheinyl transferase
MAGGNVDVWTISLEDPRPAILLPEEQTRADRFRFERDRLHWTRARSALRSILSRRLDVSPLEITFELGPHGKPAVKGVEVGIEFNLSHSGGWAMIAVSARAPVGIDLEAIRPNVNIADLLKRIGETELSGSRERLFQVWARREALTKAAGGPLMEIPEGDFRVVDLKAPAGFAAALAMAGCDPEVRYCGGGGVGGV